VKLNCIFVECHLMVCPTWACRCTVHHFATRNIGSTVWQHDFPNRFLSTQSLHCLDFVCFSRVKL